MNDTSIFFANMARNNSKKFGMPFMAAVFAVGMLETFGFYGSIPVLLRMAWAGRAAIKVLLLNAIKEKFSARPKKSKDDVPRV